MELDILANGEVGDPVGITMCQICDSTQLPGGEDSIWNSDTDHKPLQRAALATFSTSDSPAISLRVNAPPAEVGSNPFGRNRVEAVASEAADLVQSVPRILRAFQALSSLGFGLFHLY